MADTAKLRDVSYDWFGGREQIEEVLDSEIEEIDDPDETLGQRFLAACREAIGIKAPPLPNIYVATPFVEPFQGDVRYCLGIDAEFLYFNAVERLRDDAFIHDAADDLYSSYIKYETMKKQEDLVSPIPVDESEGIADDWQNLLRNFGEDARFERILEEIRHEVDLRVSDTNKDFYKYAPKEEKQDYYAMIDAFTADYVPKKEPRKPVLADFGVYRGFKSLFNIVTYE